MTTRKLFLHRFIFGLAACAGCDRSPVPDPAPTPPAAPVVAAPRVEPAAAPTSWPLEVTDGFNRKVTIPRPATRIVAIAPSNTEILFAIGAGDRVVGRTSVDTYPPEALALPSVGGMTPKSMNLEAIVALRPDLVLATCGVQEPAIAPLERLGLAVLALDADDFAGVARNIRLVGQLTDHAAAADALADRFLAREGAVRARVAARTGPRPRVFYLLSEDPLMTAGPQTFIGRMIDRAGGTNVFGDVKARYPRPSEEEILARAPEIILAPIGAMTPGQGDNAARRAQIRARAGWGQVPAIRDDRIAFLEEDRMSRPGPRLVDGLEALAAALESR